MVNKTILSDIRIKTTLSNEMINRLGFGTREEIRKCIKISLTNNKSLGIILSFNILETTENYDYIIDSISYYSLVRVTSEEKEKWQSGFNLRTKKVSSERWTQGKKMYQRRVLIRLLKSTTARME